MITNEECKEIAHKLREVDMDDFNCYSQEHEVIETVLGCWIDCKYEDQPLNERLADLIEPRTCHKVPGKMKYGRRMPACSECGYSLGDSRWNFCPKCGSEIIENAD